MGDDYRHDIDPQKPPTLLGLRKTLLDYGLKVGSLVCPGIKYKMPKRRPGIMIPMLDAAMIQRFGPFLMQTVETLRGKQNPQSRMILDPQLPVSEYLKEMERVGMYFAWFKHEETGMLVALLSGDPDDGGVITPQFCERLTALGCPTSLK